MSLKDVEKRLDELECQIDAIVNDLYRRKTWKEKLLGKKDKPPWTSQQKNMQT